MYICVGGNSILIYKKISIKVDELMWYNWVKTHKNELVFLYVTLKLFLKCYHEMHVLGSLKP